MKQDLKYWLWLSSVPGVGAVKFNKLIQQFGSPQKVWYAVKSNKYIEGIDEKTLKVIQTQKYMDMIHRYLDTIIKNNINVITLESSNYPENLKKIFDPPPIIYSRGEIILDDVNSIAIVGSRKATPYGVKVAEALANELACLGITIVSGMARGIDSYSHKGALSAGGRTIAVLGCGVDRVYPKENNQLMNNIISHGAVISEYPLGTSPQKTNFPARNRIISGLSKGVIVVEAGERSGTLITVDFALEQGREVFAVPGNINSFQSRGTNRLIKQGAKLVTCIDDILEEINLNLRMGRDSLENGENCFKRSLNTIEDTWESIEKEVGRFRDIDNKEKKILKSVAYQHKHIDDIASETGIDVGTTGFLLTMLEVKGLIKQLPGMIYSLNN